MWWKDRQICKDKQKKITGVVDGVSGKQRGYEGC